MMSEQKNAKKNSKNREKIEKNANFCLKKDERLEDLQCGGLKIIQNKRLYTFSSDSVILANFIKTRSKDVALEIGAGCGVISILVQAKNKLQKIYAFEIQSEMADLCERNVALNCLQEKIETILDDAKNFGRHLKVGGADVVFSNPPYFKQTDFPQERVRKLAREETNLSCEQLCETAAKMLKNDGAFYVCYCAERTAELVYFLQKHKLAVKEMFFTENGKGKVQTVFIKAVKNGNFGTKIAKNLVTNAQNGDYLEVLHTKNFLN